MPLNQDDIQKLKTVFATKGDLERFATKEDLRSLKNDIFNKLDIVIKELVSIRQEIAALSHRSSDHEDRLASLEEIHPGGKHASL